MVSESVIRLSVFAGVLIIMAVWELLAPRRKLRAPKSKRWTSNLLIVLLSTVIARLSPILPYTAALLAEQNELGLFRMIGFTGVFAILVSIIIQDFIIYAQHVLFHYSRFFWRFHKMHHADLDIDVTTGLRFHPLEFIFSFMIKILIVFFFGLPVISVVIFEIILNATSLFNHSNAKIPIKFDRYLRLFIVTPDMHRVHHSINPKETNRNFGFSVPWWDRLFGSYVAQPKEGHDKMTIGLQIFRNNKYLGIDWLLAMPFIQERK